MSSTAEASTETEKPLSPKELLAQIQAKAKGAAKEENDNDIQTLLSTLEKRINEGPGSLSMAEVEHFKTVGDRILADLKSQKEAEDEAVDENELSGWSTVEPDKASFPPAAAAVVDTPAPPVEAGLPSLKDLVVSPDELAIEEEGEDPEESLLSTIQSLVATEEELAVDDDEEGDSVEAAAASPAVATTASESSSSTTTTNDSGMPDYTELHEAALAMDATKVSELIEAGLEMDEATTNAAFWAVVRSVDQAEAQDKPLSADMPRMLHHIFDADLKHLLTRDQIRTNITCMQPKDDGIGGKARAMNYIFDDSSHKDLPLSEGRRCEGGTCCDACSRNIFPTFATEAEINLQTFPELASLTFNELERVSAATIIQFTRLIERVRRTMTHEYGLDLKTILPLQAYSRKYVAGTTQQGGGGGEGDHVTLHTDEATHDGYHYSCVLYLSSHGEDFEGGAFVFNDPAKNEEEAAQTAKESQHLELEEQIRRSGRKLSPVYPKKGNAVIFSSGWENMHEVETITSGTRYAVPAFFTTCPVPEAAYTQMAVGKPKTYEDIADDWLHLLLAHRAEMPHEATGRVKELLMKWHYMCTPLEQH